MKFILKTSKGEYVAPQELIGFKTTKDKNEAEVFDTMYDSITTKVGYFNALSTAKGKGTIEGVFI